eukprot:1161350-Pelagomonas_calceolata.AAC.5
MDRAANHALPTDDATRLGFITIFDLQHAHLLLQQILGSVANHALPNEDVMYLGFITIFYLQHANGLHLLLQQILDRAANHALPTEDVTRLGLITIKPPGLEDEAGEEGTHAPQMGTLPEDSTLWSSEPVQTGRLGWVAGTCSEPGAVTSCAVPAEPEHPHDMQRLCSTGSP